MIQEMDRSKDVEKILNNAVQMIEKDYVQSIDGLTAVKIGSEDIQLRNSVRLIKINKIALEKEDNVLDKLTNVYSSIISNEGALLMVIDANPKKVDFYMGVRAYGPEKSIVNLSDTLGKTFEGNFPGIRFENVYTEKVVELSEKIKSGNKISVVSGIPAIKNEEEKFVQGMEKLIDAMKGEKYTGVFIADSINRVGLEYIERGYENMYSMVSGYAEQTINITDTEGISTSESESNSITKSITESVSYTTGSSINTSMSKSSGVSNTITKTKSKRFDGKKLEGVAKMVGSGIGSIFGPHGAIIGGWACKKIVSSIDVTKSVSNAITNSTNTQIGGGASLSKSKTEGESRGTSTQKGSSTTNGTNSSKSNSVQVTTKNKRALTFLEKIDSQLERMKCSRNYGFWDAGVYFVAESFKVSRAAADTFSALMKGEKSGLEKSYVHTWGDEDKNINEIKKYLSVFENPIFDVPVNQNNRIKTQVSLTTMISTKELALEFGIPRKSVAGLTCSESAEFGRNVISAGEDKSKKIDLGRIYHLGSKEEQEVELNLNSLTKHALVTGSTGSGKSNTIYNILHRAEKKDVNFLVIEPAKGEYKKVFGGRKDVNVFGTNIRHSKLLKLNPFRFPDEIHVLEHIDSLIETLNAVWPMYAAMPNILKEGVEAVYDAHGWDLELSVSNKDEATYPTFSDLLDVLPKIIEESSYAGETQQNYTGSLVTRVKSLTNGIVGNIFGDIDIPGKILFDKNAIVDLSRIGSMETKALLMGIVFLKLKEYRMATADEMNSEIKHITVLEEAHNLLRKTSTAQGQESANLQGKSVEMIANSIAEMRTYGESFIIADQSPNLLDESAIKNTNTKIILRMPGEDDRVTVGKSMNLKEEQVNELARLETGVAAVFQNDWEEAVLCKVDYFDIDNPMEYSYDMDKDINNEKIRRAKVVNILIKDRLDDENMEIPDHDQLSRMEKYIRNQKIDLGIRDYIIKNIIMLKTGRDMEVWKQEKFHKLAKSIYSILDGDRILKGTKDIFDDKEQFNRIIIDRVQDRMVLDDKELLKENLIHLLLKGASLKSVENGITYREWVEDLAKRGGKIC